MNKIIVINQKVGLEYDEVLSYIIDLNKIKTDNNIIVCPSSIYLENFINNSNWGVGAQKVYLNDDNKNGNISFKQLKSLGIEYALIGHIDDNESDEIINKKLIECLETNIVPIYIINDDGTLDSNKVLKKLDNIEHISFIIFVYNLTLKEKNLALSKKRIKDIKNMIKNKYNENITMLYLSNIDDVKDVLLDDEIDGVLIEDISDINAIKKVV